MNNHRRRLRAGHSAGLALVLSAALVATGCATSAAERPESQAATVSASGESQEPSASSPSPEAPGSPEATPSVPSPGSSPVQPADQGQQEPTPEPAQLLYPGIDADIPVEPRGVAEDGQMDIPDDAAQAAWYEYGKAPADQVGTTVISAHAGSQETPVGPLYALKDSRPGEEVTVLDEAGVAHHYEVTQVEQLGKDGLDFAPYFERTGKHRLVLITCGGQWIDERGSYADNIIVVAEPLD
ncbi:peptidase C60 [Nesterenkonia sp. AN1]|uniref:class F sortase n=1 Tax=Nesterenkonia sp. AN1 TaxID=652017 RepID=UPI00044CC427|nr:class F sortase [Nesterenkonia sp. AN1]EXF25139.1 peptidase C60 [Nesterenkonia sp. AN1]